MLMLRTGELLVEAVLSSKGVLVLSRDSRPCRWGSFADDVMMPLEKQSVPTSLSSQSRWNVLQW